MHVIDRERFAQIVKVVPIKPRLQRELRFSPELVGNWDDLELVAIADRTGRRGLLLIEFDGKLYALPFEVSRLAADKTGRSKPITCDFCYTWQRGGKASRITFTRQNDLHSFAFLCCADLACSLHVRDQTHAACLSRAQLHEDITAAQRVSRLRSKLNQVIATLEVKPIKVDRG